MADDVAGRIDPRYSHGDLVKVARAQHQAEAEFIVAEPGTARAVERPGRLLVGLLALVALVGVIAWLGTELIA